MPGWLEEEGEGEAVVEEDEGLKDKGSLAPSDDRRVPVRRQDADLRVGKQTKPANGDGQGHEQVVQAEDRLDPGFTEEQATLVAFERLFDPEPLAMPSDGEFQRRQRSDEVPRLIRFYSLLPYLRMDGASGQRRRRQR